MEVWWLVLSLLLTVLVTIVFATCFVRHYEDPRERSCLTTTVSALAISCTLFCVFLIPVDIYTVSSSLDADGNQTHPDLVARTGDAIKWFYYALYIVLVALAFFILPFTYFYYEEGVGTDDRDALLASAGGSKAKGSINSAPRGAWGALKYTLGFAVVFAVLLTLGLVLRTTHGDGQDWKSKLSHSFNAGDAIITFCVATLACLGVFSWIIYGGYGLAAVPIRIMQKAHNDRALLAEQQAKNPSAGNKGGDAIGSGGGVADIEMQLASVQEQIKFIKSKYDLTQNEWSIKDKNEYRKLKSKETELLARQRRKESALKAGSDGRTVTERCDACWNALAPLRIVVGVVLLGVAWLVFISLLLSVIDKLQHSTCGASCGYTMDKPEIVNPLDKALIALGKAFPIDYIAFSAVVIFMFLCSVAGMVSLGIRLIGVKLWSVRPGHTMPNALLMGCWILMFVALALNLEILTFAPQYATFGAQFYYSADNSTGTVEMVRTDCTIDQSDLDAASGGSTCVMSQVARFIQLINIQLPFFGVILFFANLVWLASFFAFSVYVGLCRRRIDHQALKEEAIDDMFYGDD